MRSQLLQCGLDLLSIQVKPLACAVQKIEYDARCSICGYGLFENLGFFESLVSHDGHFHVHQFSVVLAVDLCGFFDCGVIH